MLRVRAFNQPTDHYWQLWRSYTTQLTSTGEITSNYVVVTDGNEQNQTLVNNVIRDEIKFKSYRQQVDEFSARKSSVTSPGYRIHYKPRKNMVSFPRAPHSCNHVKSIVHFENDIVRDLYPDVGVFTDTSTLKGSGLAFYQYLFGRSFAPITGMNDYFRSLPCVSAVGGLPATDWVSLYSKYDEACKSFIPSSFMIGEDIVESDIFVDAFKIMLNPSKAVGELVKTVLKFGLHINKSTTIGKIHHELLKHGSDSVLFGAFGLRPALNDIADFWNAHKKVSSRIQYLRDNAGKFVPVRVRSVSDASIDDVSDLSPNGVCETKLKVESYRRTATIGCWARVRKDINFSNVWDAYLQYFGVGKLLGLSWELIPFSFVVDWFFNIKHVINYFTRLNTGSPYCEFTAMCCSEKVEKVTKVYITAGALPFNHHQYFAEPSKPIFIAEVIDSEYNRFLDIPGSLSPVAFSGFNAFQIITGASLILQRLL